MAEKSKGSEGKASKREVRKGKGCRDNPKRMMSCNWDRAQRGKETAD